MTLSAAVTGIDSGWIVSWASTQWAQSVAIRNKANLSTTSDISTIQQAKPFSVFGWSRDSLVEYPTLAYRRRFATYGTDTIPSQVAYLAYQQDAMGVLDEGLIMAHPLFASFPTGARPLLRVGPGEHVSEGLDYCKFRHPCIALDSLRIGVAFEAVRATQDIDIILRFRDTSLRRMALQSGWWLTPAYRWGQPGRKYERPSVTHFPTADSASLRSNPQGGLVWQ